MTMIVVTKFQFKLTILLFWIKFVQKGYFWSKTGKVNIIIEFSILELAISLYKYQIAA